MHHHHHPPAPRYMGIQIAAAILFACTVMNLSLFVNFMEELWVSKHPTFDRRGRQQSAGRSTIVAAAARQKICVLEPGRIIIRSRIIINNKKERGGRRGAKEINTSRSLCHNNQETLSRIITDSVTSEDMKYFSFEVYTSCWNYSSIMEGGGGDNNNNNNDGKNNESSSSSRQDQIKDNNNNISSGFLFSLRLVPPSPPKKVYNRNNNNKSSVTDESIYERLIHHAAAGDCTFLFMIDQEEEDILSLSPGWASSLSRALHGLSPPNLGAASPLGCNSCIFVHKDTHRMIFSRLYFPLDSCWSVWVRLVYGQCRVVDGVVVGGGGIANSYNNNNGIESSILSDSMCMEPNDKKKELSSQFSALVTRGRLYISKFLSLGLEEYRVRAVRTAGK
jgi:hypothetical protein